MYSDDDLNSAVKAGVFTQASVDEFRELVDSGRRTQHQDEENFRLLSSFNDIFVVIACALLIFPLFWMVKESNLTMAFGVVAVLAWGLGEYFILRRKMALPGVFLVLCFVGGASNFGATLGGNPDMEAGLAVVFAIASAALHWFRFRVPITIAGGIAAAVFVVLSLVVNNHPDSIGTITAAAFICGLCVFSFAMFWDSTDIQRISYRSDVAFWLHLIAAPLMIHPVFYFMGFFDELTTAFSVPVVLGLYACITLISLIIDRRSLMVSALVYVVVTLGRALANQETFVDSFSSAALAMGIVLLALAIFWRPVRKIIVGLFPSSIQSKLPAIAR